MVIIRKSKFDKGSNLNRLWLKNLSYDTFKSKGGKRKGINELIVASIMFTKNHLLSK